MNLCDLGTIRSLLEKYGLKPQKSFGQNFLINPDVPRRIAGSAAVGGDCGWGGASRCGEGGVIEIGPGMGAMTKELSGLFEKVVAVEIDRGLIPLLSETLAGCDNVSVVNEDFMKLNLSEFIPEHFGDMPVSICANLPYYITSPILMSVLEAFPPSAKPAVSSITVLVQNEVGDRLCAKAGTADYGAITAAVNLSGCAEKLFTVSAGNFYPAPKVTSCVVQIKLYENGARDALSGIFLPKDDGELDKFVALTKKVIGAAFEQRRKTLTNALGAIFPKDKTTEALKVLGFREDIRGEKLSAYDFAAICAEITMKK